MTRILRDRAVQGSVSSGVIVAILAAAADRHTTTWIAIGAIWAGITVASVVHAARALRR